MQRLRQWASKGRRLIWLEYSALALFILLPLLPFGYILTLDLVFTPHAAWPQQITNTYPLQAILWALQNILPGDIVEKLVLFSILLLSGVGAHLLVSSLRVEKKLRTFWGVAAYFAGILYMINPFTYSRFMAGQWMVLLGYALLPFFVGSSVAFLRDPSWKRGSVLGLWSALLLTMSLHHAGMLVVIILWVLVVGVWHYRQDSHLLKRFVGGLALAGGAFTILSGYWLIPALLGCGTIGKSIASFDNAHFMAFATNGSGSLGALGEVVRLQGFWAEAQNLFALPQALVPAWGILFLVVWLLVVFGGIKAWRTHRLIISLGCVLIGAGVVVSATPFLQWVGGFIPFVNGYREPHKFVNLVALGFILLGAFGVAYFLEWVRRKRGEVAVRVATVVCLCLPLVLTPTMFWGFSGQLAPRAYPLEWESMNQRIKQEIPDGKRVLFLPWHQYAIYSFSGSRIIANPAQKFFEAPTIVSDEPEFRDVPPTVPNDEKRRISAALSRPESLRRLLADLNVEYIILANEQDAKKYEYLNRLDGIRLVDTNEKLKLYRVEDSNG